MNKFKGLTDWFEIFRTGMWTDAAGNTKDWSKEDLDAIVANYKPEDEEAPLVVGHPETDSPAYGWVEGIKRVGDMFAAIPKPDPDSVVEKDMYAKCEKIHKMFEEATETDHLEEAGHEATKATMYFEKYKTDPEKEIHWGGED